MCFHVRFFRKGFPKARRFSEKGEAPASSRILHIFTALLGPLGQGKGPRRVGEVLWKFHSTSGRPGGAKWKLQRGKGFMKVVVICFLRPAYKSYTKPANPKRYEGNSITLWPLVFFYVLCILETIFFLIFVSIFFLLLSFYHLLIKKKTKRGPYCFPVFLFLFSQIFFSCRCYLSFMFFPRSPDSSK